MIGRRARIGTAAVALTLACAQGATAQDDRYALANGCYALKAKSGYVAKSGGGWRANVTAAGDAERFRMQATALGRYLFYGRGGEFVAGGSNDSVVVATTASEAADFRVDGRFGDFTISLPSAGRSLAVSGGNLDLGGPGETFDLEKASGCATYPEVETSATGEPRANPLEYGEVLGSLESHMHTMSFEAFGGYAICGRPWHPYGAPHALVDCFDHYPSGEAAVLDKVRSGKVAGQHDPVGWPTFKDWPAHDSTTHQQSYYKWIERAWLGGLRLYVNLYADNAPLCLVYPYKRNDCNEMVSVRLQARQLRALEDYIDAQSGGPGKGWFRLVEDPFEARRVINQGKLAVVQGIEVSNLFDCGIYNDEPQCDSAQVDRQIDEFHELGIREMEVVNKFDNAFAGVAGDEGAVGIVSNGGNRLMTGKFIDFAPCQGPPGAEDMRQISPPGTERDSGLGGATSLLPSGAAPVYPSGPQCNRKGLSTLGEHLVRRMIEKKMIIDPDHMGVLARNHLIALVEAHDYSGIVSSHSWSTPDAFSRIYRLGGFMSPYAGDSVDFVTQWRQYRAASDPRYLFGIGYGADMGGLGPQGAPRKDADRNPVTYPYKSLDGAVTLERQRSGRRVYDINQDGVAHYGLYPDWIQDLGNIAGPEIVRDVGRASEGYLQMWERTEGVPGPQCRSARGKFTASGLFGAHLGDTPRELLQRAGQPEDRAGRGWGWCVQGNRNGGTRLSAVFTPQGKVGMVTTSAFGHRADRVERGNRLRRVGRVRRIGRGLYVRRPRGRLVFVYGVRRGRVRFIAAATKSVGKSRRSVREYLKLAELG